MDAGARTHTRTCMRVCVCARARASAGACTHACVRAFVRTWVMARFRCCSTYLQQCARRACFRAFERTFICACACACACTRTAGDKPRSTPAYSLLRDKSTTAGAEGGAVSRLRDARIHVSVCACGRALCVGRHCVPGRLRQLMGLHLRLAVPRHAGACPSLRPAVCVRERETEKETETETETGTETGTGAETGTGTGTVTGRQRERETERQRDRES
jgi:hypothetical protein